MANTPAHSPFHRPWATGAVAGIMASAAWCASACGSPSNGLDPTATGQPAASAGPGSSSDAAPIVNSPAQPARAGAGPSPVRVVSKPARHGLLPSATDPAPSKCDTPPVSLNALASAVAGDLAQFDPVNRPYMRYVNLAHNPAIGPCETDPVSAGGSVHVALNALSLSASLSDFEAVQTLASVFRIDLRDLGWDAPLQVGEVEFSDAWQALVANSRFRFDWSQQALEELEPLSAPASIVLRADELAYLATNNELYVALLAIPEWLDELRAELEVDVLLDFEEQEVERAGIATEGGYLLAERHDLGNRRGSFWQLYELPQTDDLSGFAPWFGADLIALQARYNAPTNVLYSLPNGMFAAARFGEDGRRVDNLSNAGAERSSYVSGLGCLSCHQLGPVPLIDEVAPAAPRRSYFPGINRQKNAPRTAEVIRQWYPEPRHFEQVVHSDQVEHTFSFSGLGFAVTDQASLVRTLLKQYWDTACAGQPSGPCAAQP